MVAIELPSISKCFALSPPSSPHIYPAHPVSQNEPVALVVGWSEKRTHSGSLSRQLPRPPIHFTEPQYGNQHASTRVANSDQQLPPISHILADIPSPSSLQHAPLTPGYITGGFPTPLLSATATSHHFRFPGLENFPLMTPPPSRQPSLVDIRLPEQHVKTSPHECHSCRAAVWPTHCHMSPDRSAQHEKRKREPEHHKRSCRPKQEEDEYEGSRLPARVIELSSSDETCPDEPQYPIVKVKKTSRRKNKQSSGTKSGGSSKPPKRSNNKYPFVQSLFVIYHTVDLGLPWKETAARLAKWFPERTEGGVQCQYYRLNARIPVANSEGLLDLGPFTKKELDDKKVVSQDPYPPEGGVRYRIHELKCRQDRTVTLAERFPEEVVYGNHPWILPEHRNDEKTRLAADKRARQRAEHLRYHLGKASKR